MTGKKRSSSRRFNSIEYFEARTLLSATPAAIATLGPTDRAETLIVSFRPETPLPGARGLLSTVGVTLVRADLTARVALVAVEPGGDPDETLARLRDDPSVRAADPNRTIPVDPREIARGRALAQRHAEQQTQLDAYRDRQLALRRQRLAVRPDSMGTDSPATPDLGVRYRYDHTPTRDDVIAATGGAVVSISPDQRNYQLSYAPGTDLVAIRDRLEADPRVLYVQPAAVARLGPEISDTGVLPASEVDLTLGAADDADPERIIRLINSVGGAIAYVAPGNTSYSLAFGPNRNLDVISAFLMRDSSLVQYVVPNLSIPIDQPLDDPASPSGGPDSPPILDPVAPPASGGDPPTSRDDPTPGVEGDTFPNRFLEVFDSSDQETSAQIGPDNDRYEIAFRPDQDLDAVGELLEQADALIREFGPADVPDSPSTALRLGLGFKQGVTPEQAAEVIAATGGTVTDYARTDLRYDELDFGPGSDLAAIADQLEADPRVSFVLPDAIGRSGPVLWGFAPSLSESDLIVGVEDDASPRRVIALFESVGAVVRYAQVAPGHTYYALAFGPNQDPEAIGDVLEADAMVRYVSPIDGDATGE